MSIQYTVPGFEFTTFETWVSFHNHSTWAPTPMTREVLGSNRENAENKRKPADLFWRLLYLQPFVVFIFGFVTTATAREKQ